MSVHDPFSGPEQCDQARRTVAKQARNSDDEHLILAALGLDEP